MRTALVILAVALIFYGCDFNEVDLDLKLEKVESDIAVPLGESVYTMRELFAEATSATVNEDPESTLLSLSYSTTASYTHMGDYLTIDDINNVPWVENLPTGSDAPVPFSFSTDQPYQPQDDEELDSVFHDQGTVSVSVATTSAFPVDYVLEFASTEDVNMGTPLSFSGIVNNATPDNFATPLDGYKTLFTRVGSENMYRLNLTGNVVLSGGQSIGAGETITVTVSFLNQTFDVVFGKFGQDTVEVSTSIIDIDFFQDVNIAGIQFGNPVLTFEFASSFGIPLGIDFSTLYGEDSTGARTFLRGDVVNTPPVVASAPTSPFSSLGQAEQTTIVVNSSNSSINDILAVGPSQLGINLGAISNPYDPSQINYVTDTSTIRTSLTVDLPMEVAMQDVEKVFDFDLGDGVQFDETDSVSLRLVTENELPFSGEMDMYILNAANDTLYRALENVILASPFLNAQREVTEPQINIEDVPLGKAGIDALNVGDRIVVRVRMTTPQSQTSEEIFVKILARYELRVKLGLRGILNVKI